MSMLQHKLTLNCNYLQIELIKQIRLTQRKLDFHIVVVRFTCRCSDILKMISPCNPP